MGETKTTVQKKQDVGDNTAPAENTLQTDPPDNTLQTDPPDNTLQTTPSDNTLQTTPSDNTLQTTPSEAEPSDDAAAQKPGGSTAIQENAPPAQAPSDAGRGQSFGDAVQDLQQTTDDLNLKIGQMAHNVQGPHAAQEAQETDNGTFDTLPVEWKEEEDTREKPEKVDKELWDLKVSIGKKREGELYQAVLVARELKNGRNNPLARGRARRYLSKSLNSSVWDTSSTVNKMTANVVGGASALDMNGQLKSVWQGATLITNFVSLVTISRDLFIKFKTFGGGSTMDKVFKAVAILGDIAMFLSKACSIAKTITNYFGGVKIPAVKETIKWIILALNMGNQLASITTASRAVHTGRQKYKALKASENSLWENDVSRIVDEYGIPDEQSTEEKGISDEQSGEENAVSDNQSGEENAVSDGQPVGEEDQGSVQAEDEQISSVSTSLRVKQAEALLKSEHVSEKDKDILIRYLAVTARKDKVKNSLITTSTGLAAAVTGICSSLFTSAVYGAGYFEKSKAFITGYGSMGASLITNSVAFASGAVKMNRNHSNKKDTRAGQIGERLWHKLNTLGEDKYGLKGLEDGIAAKKTSDNDIKNAASEVDKMYDDTKGLFADIGVPYQELLRTHNEESFRRILAAGV